MGGEGVPGNSRKGEAVFQSAIQTSPGARLSSSVPRLSSFSSSLMPAKGTLLLIWKILSAFSRVFQQIVKCYLLPSYSPFYYCNSSTYSGDIYIYKQWISNIHLVQKIPIIIFIKFTIFYFSIVYVFHAIPCIICMNVH